MTKREKIKLLMQFTNVGSRTESSFKEKIDVMPLEGSDEDIAIMRKSIMDKFKIHHKAYTESQIDVYDKHLSDEAVDTSIAFYTSPEGEVVISKMPFISKEIEQLGFILSKSILNDIVEIVDEFDAAGDDYNGYDSPE